MDRRGGGKTKAMIVRPRISRSATALWPSIICATYLCYPTVENRRIRGSRSRLRF